MSRRSAAMKAAAALMVAAAAGWPASSSAQATIGAEMGMAELEQGFWVCDHAATVGPIDSDTAVTCGSLTEMLKQRKFSGDFNAMLTWWRQHKEVEHLALAIPGRVNRSVNRRPQP
jgi:hypothetical protein